VSRSIDLFYGAFRYLGFEELTWTVRVSVVQFISSVSALTAVGRAAGLSGETHLGSVVSFVSFGIWPQFREVPAAVITGR
jgi:hypothetical protein